MELLKLFLNDSPNCFFFKLHVTRSTIIQGNSAPVFPECQRKSSEAPELNIYLAIKFTKLKRKSFVCLVFFFISPTASQALEIRNDINQMPLIQSSLVLERWANFKVTSIPH